jgi:hypothetical protein
MSQFAAIKPIADAVVRAVPSVLPDLSRIIGEYAVTRWIDWDLTCQPPVCFNRPTEAEARATSAEGKVPVGCTLSGTGHYQFSAVLARSTLRESGLRRWTLRVTNPLANECGYGLMVGTDSSLTLEQRGQLRGSSVGEWVDTESRLCVFLSDSTAGLRVFTYRTVAAEEDKGGGGGGGAAGSYPTPFQGCNSALNTVAITFQVDEKAATLTMQAHGHSKFGGAAHVSPPAQWRLSPGFPLLDARPAILLWGGASTYTVSEIESPAVFPIPPPPSAPAAAK